MMNIIYAVAVLGILGGVFGAVLAFAAKIFYVEQDERIDQIVAVLPGANCGGCGYAGCSNCAVLGVVLLNTQNNYNFIESLVYGVTGGIGFLIAIVLFASIREKLRFTEYPKSFEGFPIALVTAALLALAFMGFSGMKIW